MAHSKMTILAFNNYYRNDESISLFDKMTMPEGIDRDVVIDNILLRGAEFEVLYANPDFMRDGIGLWSDKWFNTFNRWVKALNIEYNPLENYDRIEDSETINTGTVGTVGTTSADGSDKISAYDSDTLRDNTSSHSSGSDSSTQTNNLNEKRISRIHGNVGVTTSQQMLQSELDIARFNLIEQITDVFLKEFCILVY